MIRKWFFFLTVSLWKHLSCTRRLRPRCPRNTWCCGQSHCSTSDLWRRTSNDERLSQSLVMLPERLNVLTLSQRGVVLHPGADQSVKKMKQQVSEDLLAHFPGPGSSQTSLLQRNTLMLRWWKRKYWSCVHTDQSQVYSHYKKRTCTRWCLTIM